MSKSWIDRVGGGKAEPRGDRTADHKRRIVRKPEGGEYGETERYGGADYQPVHAPDPDSDVEPAI